MIGRSSRCISPAVPATSRRGSTTTGRRRTGWCCATGCTRGWWVRGGTRGGTRAGRGRGGGERAGDDRKVFQVYFTGCAGNVTAGKYNDGSKANRVVLRDRVYAGMVGAWKDTVRHPVKTWEWRVEAVKFAPRREKEFGERGSE